MYKECDGVSSIVGGVSPEWNGLFYCAVVVKPEREG